jgi:O-methyltransferase
MPRLDTDKLRQLIPSRIEAVKLLARLLWEAVTFPMTVAALFHNPKIHPAYGFTWWDKYRLAFRIYRNGFRIITATSFKAHLAMAAKLLEIPPSTEGVVVECGSFLGGSAANLSIICDAVDRDLIIYDSFEGMPLEEEGDQYGIAGAQGLLRGDLEVVRRNITRFGVIERCTFRKGWFSDTLPDHREPIVACFLDVDYQASLHDCVLNLWPHLTDQGYVFIDEYVHNDFCACSGPSATGGPSSTQPRPG